MCCKKALVEDSQHLSAGVSVQVYDDVFTHLIAEAQAIVVAKRPSYTAESEDVLANFRRIANITGLTPGQVLTVYMMKHVLSVCSSLTKSTVADPEPILGRFADAVNYLALGYAMLNAGIAHERGSK